MTRIQDDLFATVNAEWLENAEIPADKPRILAFDELVLKNELAKVETLNTFEDFKNNLTGSVAKFENQTRPL